MKEVSTYDYLKEYLNSLEEGYEFKIGDIINYVSNIADNTIRNYVRRLMKLGYVSRRDRGIYEKRMNIPDDFNTSDLLTAYKNKRYLLTSNSNKRSKLNIKKE